MDVRAGKRRGRQPALPDSPVLRDIVRRIVEVANPQTIILFGSAARGANGPNSDVDLLVVKGGRFHRGRLIEAVYRRLRGAGAPVDLVIVTPEEIQQYRNDPCLVIAPALREGRLIYGSETPAAE
jgi:predicted nucleotidyltransferase